jgi:hypothetical protein
VRQNLYFVDNLHMIYFISFISNHFHNLFYCLHHCYFYTIKLIISSIFLSIISIIHYYFFNIRVKRRFVTEAINLISREDDIMIIHIVIIFITFVLIFLIIYDFIYFELGNFVMLL